MSHADEHTHLIHGLHIGDETSVKTLFAMYYRSLRYFAERLLRNQAEAEDIVVETFLKLLKRKSDFSELRTIRAFLFTAVKNACIDYIRKQKHRRMVGERVEDLADEPLSFENHDAITAQLLQTLYAEIENLPGQCKKIFKEIFLEGKTTSVVAEEMGLRPQTVLNQKMKALRMLRLKLFKEGVPLTGSFMFLLGLLRNP